MPLSRDTLIGLMITLEGGLVNNPADPGGATKYGITQRTLDSLQGKPMPNDARLPTNVADLTPFAATAIYQATDWAQIQGDALPPTLAALMLNAAVNVGEPTAAMMLQTMLGVKADGVIGPGTLAALKTWRSPYMPAQTVAEEFAAQLAVHYAKLDGRLDQFELGWFRRLFRVYTLVLTLPPNTQ